MKINSVKGFEVKEIKNVPIKEETFWGFLLPNFYQLELLPLIYISSVSGQKMIIILKPVGL